MQNPEPATRATIPGGVPPRDAIVIDGRRLTQASVVAGARGRGGDHARVYPPVVVEPDAMADYLLEVVTHEQAVAALTDTIRTVITQDGWKFNWSRLGQHELYNLTNDLGETANLARDPAEQPRRRDLTDRIRQWQQRTGDTVTISDPD